jgi:hypothetical protein
MTGKTDFTEEEWKLVSEGPATAGMIVSTSESGGSFRESFAMAKAYAEARQAHGTSELLDAIVASKPQFDRHKFHSADELRAQGPGAIHDAVALLEQKASAEEVDAYRGFVVGLAERVAGAHKEHGAAVSAAESEALDAIRASVAAGA